MRQSEMAGLMTTVFGECHDLRDKGQKEYAHDEDDAFANFKRVAERLKITKEQVLMVYLEKHIDGIHSYIQGHQSQREDVRGRINDVIVYLCLLRGMIEENDVMDNLLSRSEGIMKRTEELESNEIVEEGDDTPVSLKTLQEGSIIRDKNLGRDLGQDYGAL